MQDLLNSLADSFRRYWADTVQPELAPATVKVAIALAILVAALKVGAHLRRLSTHAVSLTRADAGTALLIGHLVQLGALAVGGILALGVLGVQFGALIALVGAISVAISFAIQDVLKNFVAGLYLLVERPFAIGQEVKFKDHVGTVQTVGIRTTVLKTADNLQVVIPNAAIFTEVLVNRDAYGGPAAAEPALPAEPAKPAE